MFAKEKRVRCQNCKEHTDDGRAKNINQGIAITAPDGRVIEYQLVAIEVKAGDMPDDTVLIKNPAGVGEGRAEDVPNRHKADEHDNCEKDNIH